MPQKVAPLQLGASCGNFHQAGTWKTEERIKVNQCDHVLLINETEELREEVEVAGEDLRFKVVGRSLKSKEKVEGQQDHNKINTDLVQKLYYKKKMYIKTTSFNTDTCQLCRKMMTDDVIRHKEEKKSNKTVLEKSLLPVGFSDVAVVKKAGDSLGGLYSPFDWGASVSTCHSRGATKSIHKKVPPTINIAL